jgi:hypothetical protein
LGVILLTDIKANRRTMIKKTIALTIIMLTILSFLTFTSNATGSIKSVKVGDYIKFGRYNGDSILWRVININEDGSAMIFSEKILCLKPFDAAESGVVGELGGGFTTDEFRQKYGSNKWSNSNLHEWLNSSQKKVKYTTQAPTDKAVYGGMNNYEAEAGFLSNFTQKEQEYIMSAKHKCLLAEVDNGPNISGSKAHLFNTDIKSAITNYESSYYENIMDKVFVPDIKELHDYVYARGWDYRRVPTDKALDISEKLWDGSNMRKYYEKKAAKGWFFWLRTPSSYFSSSMRFVNQNGLISEIGAISGNCGIAPALNLKAAAPISGGSGTLERPYVY